MPQTARSILCLTFALLLFTPHPARGGGLIYSSQNGSGVFKESSASSNLGLGRGEITLVAFGLALGSLTISLTVKLTLDHRNKKRVARFKSRYARSARAINRDLKRRRGPQYQWVVNKLLEIPQERQKMFKCILRQNQDDLNKLITRAQSKRGKGAKKIAKRLILFASQSRSKKTKCALLRRYLRDPAGFKHGVFNNVIGGASKFVKLYADVPNGDLTKFHCLLRAHRAELEDAFQAMDRPKTRDAGAKKLDMILKEMGGQAKRNARCEDE